MLFKKVKKGLVKFFIGLTIVISLRFVPHPPNVEPIMSTMMPFAKKWGRFAGLLFAVTAILAFDIITGTLGVWSIMTAGTYGLLGLLAGRYFITRRKRIHYVSFAVVGTIIYDAITGIGTGMLFFNQTFMATFIGQIPFTLYHLSGNVVLAAFISPLLYKWVISNPRLETQVVSHKIRSIVFN